MAGMREPGEQSGPSLRGLFPILVVDVACPYLAYRLLTQYIPGIFTTIALGLAGVFPAGGSVASLARRRRLDIIGAIVLIGIVVSIAAVLLGEDPKIVLIREPFVTGCPRHRVPRLASVPAAALVLHWPGVLNGERPDANRRVQ